MIEFISANFINVIRREDSLFNQFSNFWQFNQSKLVSKYIWCNLETNNKWHLYKGGFK